MKQFSVWRLCRGEVDVEMEGGIHPSARSTATGAIGHAIGEGRRWSRRETLGCYFQLAGLSLFLSFFNLMDVSCKSEELAS
jgi:hypothetical protein